MVNTRQGAVTPLAATSDLAAACDRAQCMLGEGPSIGDDGSALAYVADLSHEVRWPRWSALADQLGARALLSVRILADGVPSGALTVYSTRRGDFADLERRLDAEETSDQVARQRAARVAAQVETALIDRHRMALAQGLLMGKRDLSPEEAASSLLAMSNARNGQLTEVACDVLRLHSATVTTLRARR